MSTTILNPDNYLNHLLPTEAFQFEVARNLYLAVLGATIWDILVYIPDDIKILRMRKGIRAVNACFILSRLFALCYVLLSVIEKTVPVESCDALLISIGCVCILSIWTSSFLFLRRVQAVYADNPWVQRAFFILWLADGGLEVTVAIGVRATHIPGTSYCIDSEVKHYVLAGGLSPVVFDTLVFLAISYKIASAHSTQDTKVSWSTLVSGKALPRLSRAILQGGQQYYLLTSGSYIMLVILLTLPEISPVYRNMFAFPSVSLTASMACRVYRNIKLLDLREETTLLPISDLDFAREDRSNGNGSYGLPFPYVSSQPTRLRRQLGGNTSSGTPGVDSTIKAQGSWTEQPAALQKPERSLTSEVHAKVKH